MENTSSSEISSGRFFRKIQFLSKHIFVNISSAFSWRKYFLGAVCFSLLAVFISSCKDPEELGLEVQPTSDQLSVINTDTASLITTTVKEDTLLGKGVTYQLLGSCNDPVFGRSDASFYGQVVLGLSPVLGASGDVLVADSLVLSMTYAGYYGDTSSAQIAHVYRITQDFLSDSAYYTNKTFTDDGVDLASGYSFIPSPLTHVSINSVDQPGQLRIPLSMSLATELLSLNGGSNFADNSAWVNYFKGLYVKTDPENVSGKGAISYFDLTSAYSKLTLYFHNVTTAKDSLHYDFYFSNTQTVNHHEHFYNGTATDVGHQLMDPTFNDSLNYIQSMAGVKTKITLPYLNHFTDSGSIVINKAELDITVQAGDVGLYTQPSRLFLVAIDSAGQSNFPADYFEGASYFGGGLSSTNRTYKFNIARQLQKIIDGKIADYGFYLVVTGSVVQGNRVVIGSSKNTTYPMKLRLFYTKLH